MANLRVGVQLHPQHCSMDDLRDAWRRADSLGVDSIWVWDHFYPLYGEPDGAHFECWSMLATMAADTERARLGALVSCNTYRNPDLLADMARTIDHVAGGRMYLGIGSGWFERDYAEYGYPFGTPATRLAAFEDGLQRIKARLGKLTPGPVGDMPILIGAGGERVGLRLTAQYADSWNWFGTPAEWAHKSAVLDEWCAKVGREPAQIERTVALLEPAQAEAWREYADAGATHLIYGVGAPFDFGIVETLMAEVKTAA